MVRTSSLPTSMTIFLCAITLAFLSSCTSNKGPSTVKITIPNFSNSSSKVFSQNLSTQNVSAQSEGGSWGLADPTALAEFKCFGIFVGGPDSGLDIGKAFDVNANPVFSFGIVKGLVGPGGSINVVVPSGPRRTITLIGFVQVSGVSCESLTNESHDLSGSLYSAPFILAQTTLDLSPGDTPPITLQATYSAATSIKLGDVQFPNGGGGGGGSTIYLGSGLDGDIIVNGTMFLNSMTNSLGQYLSTTARVPIISRPSPMLLPNKYNLNLTGTITTFTSNHFGAGDEVMLYVSAARGTGCGPNVAPGFRFPGKVLSAPAANYIDVNFTDDRISTIPAATLLNNASSANFCRVSITRVPQINKLTLNSGAYLKMLPFSGHSMYSEGGLMFLRVRDRIEMSGAGTSYIWMGASGYNGAASANYPGEGEQGLVSSAQINSVGAGGGGGFSVTSASGGGHGGLGGYTNGGATLGDQYGCQEPGLGDPNMHCLMGKIFMGGGGGSHNTPTGNNGGGGIVSIFTNNILVGTGQQLNIIANGGSGGISTAGGAGGAILVRAINLNITSALVGAFNLQAAGGSATGHGGGGGGRIHLDLIGSCNSAPTVVSAGISGGSGSTAGASGTSFFTGPAATQCALPVTTPAL